MTRLMPLALAAALLATPLAAQDSDEGQSLLDQGADLLRRGLTEQLAPQIEELSGVAAEYLPTLRLLWEEMGPAFFDVFGQIDSIANYEVPEILPNGDILLRRSPDAPDWTPPEPEAAPLGDPDAPQIDL